MPGTIIFKPLEANLNNDGHPVKSADPYCIFTMGSQRLQSKTCKESGDHPHWSDSIIMKTHDSQPLCLVELKAKEKNPAADNIGSFEVDLSEVELQGKVMKWYPFFNRDKITGQILLEATYTPDHYKEESNVQQKSHQGSLPHGIDLDEYAREGMRWKTEPINSLAKIAETNEFGDYQPMKQLSSGDILHQRGDGMIGQGMYYSGQQTSYGEAFPMAHKSVGTNLLGNYRTEHGAAYDRANPRDYALYQQQAFDTHEFRTTIDMDHNTSVVEKAFNAYKKDERNSNKGFISGSTPKISMGTKVQPADSTNDQYVNQRPAAQKSNIMPPENAKLIIEEQHKEQSLWESPINIHVDQKIIDETNANYARNLNDSKIPLDEKVEGTAKDFFSQKDFRDIKDRSEDKNNFNQASSTRPQTAYSENLSTNETEASHWDA